MPKHILIANIIEARSLLPSDLDGWSDPFVSVYLDDKKIFRSKYISRTLNPKWNETLRFPFKDKKHREAKKLSFRIYDHDSIGPHDFLGQYQIEISDLIDGLWIEGWFRLKDEEYKENIRGYIRLKMQLILEGKDLFRDEDKNPNINLDRAQRLITEQERRQIASEMSELSNIHATHVEEQKNANNDNNAAMIERARQMNGKRSSTMTLPQENEELLEMALPNP